MITEFRSLLAAKSTSIALTVAEPGRGARPGTRSAPTGNNM